MRLWQIIKLLRDITFRLDMIEEKIDMLDFTKLDAILVDLDAVVVALQQPNPLDQSKLDAAVTKIAADVDALKALVPPVV